MNVTMAPTRLALLVFVLVACAVAFVQCAREEENNAVEERNLAGWNCRTAVPALPWSSVRRACPRTKGPFSWSCCRSIKGVRNYAQLRKYCWTQIRAQAQRMGYDVNKLHRTCRL
eukprot:TRINITY_DN409_c1_g1_i3.p1 TRINITY_DN409_c1_g1~~TRINITY_DN409_c1_g1_i3.p1  ORF type:complete len:115 (-),score=0.77 TRINITY_DN409_c1_g1_i3:801-1145(-)